METNYKLMSTELWKETQGDDELNNSVDGLIKDYSMKEQRQTQTSKVVVCRTSQPQQSTDWLSFAVL